MSTARVPIGAPMEGAWVGEPFITEDGALYIWSGLYWALTPWEEWRRQNHLKAALWTSTPPPPSTTS